MPRAIEPPVHWQAEIRDGIDLKPCSVGVGLFGLDLAADRRCHGPDQLRLSRTGTAQIQPYLSHAQYNQSDCERREIIKQSKQEQACQDRFLVKLPKRHEHGRIEDAKASRRVARKSE